MNEKKSIWHKHYELEEINLFNQNTLVSCLGISITALNPTSIEGTMPINENTIQPYGLLHGGASCVLSESLASIGSNLIIDPKFHMALGLSIEATHLRPVKQNTQFVRGLSTIIHQGRTLHLWNTKIYDHNDQLICDSKMSIIIKNKE